MFGAQALEVAIGLATFFLFLSIVCSTLNEWIAAIFKLRANNLQKAVCSLLNDKEGKALALEVFKHPLVSGLTSKSNAKPLEEATSLSEISKPSYIPSKNFVLALLDTLTPNDPGIPQETPFESLRATVAKIQNETIKKAMLPLIDESGKNYEVAKKNLETWFDESMNRASGWYKRQSHMIVFVLATIVTLGLNADSFAIADLLWREDALRASIVATAEKVSQSDATAVDIKVVSEYSRELQIPLGWANAVAPATFWDLLIKIMGLLTTAVAISLGAPFWFDMVNKLISIRAAGRRPEMSTGK